MATLTGYVAVLAFETKNLPRRIVVGEQARLKDGGFVTTVAGEPPELPEVWIPVASRARRRRSAPGRRLVRLRRGAVASSAGREAMSASQGERRFGIMVESHCPKIGHEVTGATGFGCLAAVELTTVGIRVAALTTFEIEVGHANAGEVEQAITRQRLWLIAGFGGQKGAEGFGVCPVTSVTGHQAVSAVERIATALVLGQRVTVGKEAALVVTALAGNVTGVVSGHLAEVRIEVAIPAGAKGDVAGNQATARFARVTRFAGSGAVLAHERKPGALVKGDIGALEPGAAPALLAVAALAAGAKLPAVDVAVTPVAGSPHAAVAQHRLPVAGGGAGARVARLTRSASVSSLQREDRGVVKTLGRSEAVGIVAPLAFAPQLVVMRVGVTCRATGGEPEVGALGPLAQALRQLGLLHQLGPMATLAGSARVSAGQRKARSLMRELLLGPSPFGKGCSATAVILVTIDARPLRRGTAAVEALGSLHPTTQGLVAHQAELAVDLFAEHVTTRAIAQTLERSVTFAELAGR